MFLSFIQIVWWSLSSVDLLLLDVLPVFSWWVLTDVRLPASFLENVLFQTKMSKSGVCFCRS